MKPVELLAPAGDRDAALAALQYGADAIYLGLQQFSARAEAANFTPDELGEIVAFAHAATPARRVFVAINTLVTNAELEAVIASLVAAGEAGADALIVQDAGVAALARRHVPGLALHASTQMAIHNVAGAQALRRLGFSRVTLARELTLDEIRAVAAESGLEVEVFIHGALCYSYSGLCLYSSVLRGRSGNRGRCSYPCRERFTGPAGSGCLPFSMKDLALPDAVRDMRQAGVTSFKIEGRKKSALYVACTTAYYRGLLDGRLTPADRTRMESDIQTVFSRPWTRLYVGGRRNRDVVDTAVVGHRGAPIGTVDAVSRRDGVDWLQFTTRRRLERHDGLQFDVPGEERPFGFGIDKLRGAGGGRLVFEVPVGTRVEVELPVEHPRLERGTTVYCASSQEVKNRYRFERPKPGLYRTRVPIQVRVAITPVRLAAEARMTDAAGSSMEPVNVGVDGAFAAARAGEQVEAAVRQAFGKLGDTPFTLAGLDIVNPEGLFVPVSALNRLRRAAMTALGVAHADARAARLALICAVEAGPQGVPSPGAAGAAGPGATPAWAIKTDRVTHLDAFEPGDWAGLAEVVLDIGRDPLADIRRALAAWGRLTDPDRIRLALPMITREWERGALAAKIGGLLADGWRRWEAANLSAWTYLGEGLDSGTLSLAADWSIHVTNRLAARAVLEWGATGFTCSPEDGGANLRELLAEFGEQATVIAYQDTPLFVAETCARAAIQGHCDGAAACEPEEQRLTSAHGEAVRLLTIGCRTVVVGEAPYSLGGRIKELVGAGARRLRADFIYRGYSPADVCNRWRALRTGRALPGTHEGAYARGFG